VEDAQTRAGEYLEEEADYWRQGVEEARSKDLAEALEVRVVAVVETLTRLLDGSGVLVDERMLLSQAVYSMVLSLRWPDLGDVVWHKQDAGGRVPVN
jgi:hypothetical protein